MWYALFARSPARLFALAAAAFMLAPTAAQAQPYDCFYYDTGGIFYNIYSECQEAGSGTSAVGANLAGIGEAFVQQQLNVGAGIAGFASPTGRLRHTEHDGLKDKATGTRTSGFDIDEGSIFANVSYDLPGTYFGGKVRINGLVGYNRLSQDFDTPGAKTDIDAFIYGGSYLWSRGSFYSMALILGVTGDADARAAGAESTGGAGGGDYGYDISGYFTNSVIGYTFDWPGNGLRFDLRGGLGHYDLNSANISSRSKATLDALGTALQDDSLKNASIMIAGHTDASGRAEYNQTLSERRAEAVRGYLSDKFDVTTNTLTVVGYGAERLKDPHAPRAGINRRVQIVNLTDSKTASASRPISEPGQE
jgi:flagellar motor protein MotB